MTLTCAHNRDTVPLGGRPIKRTPSIKPALSRAPKLTSLISLYNEPLFCRHLYQVDADTKVNCIWIISVVKNLLSAHRTELSIP